ncbi:MAG: hypothetical protein K9L70_00880 [Thiohalocapsa sp.]|nr:hypothetical protein [Thiohalocapsa sp.]MCF7990153.1 hypothetical protein [Thiohalocapsa sp.]
MFRDHMLRELRVLAAVVGENCISALVFDSPESAREKLATLSGEYQLRSATLYDGYDRVFARWRQPQGPHIGMLAPMVEIVRPMRFDGRRSAGSSWRRASTSWHAKRVTMRCWRPVSYCSRCCWRCGCSGGRWGVAMSCEVDASAC